MTGEACVIGLDIGTSGVRTVAMDQQGKLLPAEAKCTFSDLAGDPRSAELWWQAVQQALSGIMRLINDRPVVAICVDGTSGTVLPIDQNGVPLAAPMMYNDVVTETGILLAITQHMPSNSAAGGATSGLAKALNFLNCKPAKIIHQADWVVGKLSGHYGLSDANNALKTGYDAVNACWPDWLEDAGLDRSLLPDVHIPGTPMINISAALGDEFGLPGDCRVIAGTTDGCASFLATGACEPGDAVTALGSTMTLKVLSDKPVYAPEYGVYSHLVGDLWLAGGASNTGGAVLAGFFNTSELEQLSPRIDVTKTCGLDYYPLLRPGERFPINDPALEPRLSPRPKDNVQFLHGLLAGMASVEALGYQRLSEQGAPAIKSVRSVGGGASNVQWTQLRQERLAVPFKTSESTEAAAGSARLAYKAATESKLW